MLDRTRCSIWFRTLLALETADAFDGDVGTAKALGAVAAAAAGGGEQLSECAECGDKIPPARLAALAGRACLRCADCQGVFEGLKQRGLA